MKAVRMTVTSTVVITAPLADNEQYLTELSTADKLKIRERMKADMHAQAKQSGSKIKSIIVSGIYIGNVKDAD